MSVVRRPLSKALLLTAMIASVGAAPPTSAGDDGAYEHSRPIDSPDAVFDTDVAPEEASIYLDGKKVGTADDFDGNPGYLVISPGPHTLEFRAHGYQSLRIELEARPSRFYPIDRKLPKGNSNEVRVESWVHAG
jgi:hypothetical protein